MSAVSEVLKATFIIMGIAFSVAYFFMIINGIANLLRWKAEIAKLKFEEKKYELRARFSKGWQDKIKF